METKEIRVMVEDMMKKLAYHNPSILPAILRD